MSIELLTQTTPSILSWAGVRRYGDVKRPSVGFTSMWVTGHQRACGLQLPSMYKIGSNQVTRTTQRWQVLDETDAVLVLETRRYTQIQWETMAVLRTAIAEYESEEAWLAFCEERNITEAGMETQHFLLRIIQPTEGDDFTWGLERGTSTSTAHQILVSRANVSRVVLSSVQPTRSKKRPSMERLGMNDMSFSMRVGTPADNGQLRTSKTIAYCIPIVGYDLHLAKVGKLSVERRNLIIENFQPRFSNQIYDIYDIPCTQNYFPPELRGEPVKIGHLAFYRIGKGSKVLVEDQTLHELADWDTPYPIVSVVDPLELSFDRGRQVTEMTENCIECEIEAGSRYQLPPGAYIIVPIRGCSHYYNLNDLNYNGLNAQYNTRAVLARLMMAVEVGAGGEDMIRFNVAKTQRITQDTGYGADDGLLDRLPF